MLTNMPPNAAPAQAPQAPTAPGQAAAASPTPGTSPTLSTELLTARVRASLSGEPQPSNAAAPAGSEPSPASAPASAPPVPSAPAAPNPPNPNANAPADSPPPGEEPPKALIAALDRARSKARVQKREAEDQLAAEREQSAETLNQLRTEIAQLRDLVKQRVTAPPEPATPPPPETPHEASGSAPNAELARMQADLANSEGWVAWCQKNPNGGEAVLADGSKRSFDAEGVAEVLQVHSQRIPELRADLRAEQRITKHLASLHEKELQDRAVQIRGQSERTALAWLPDLAKPDSVATAYAQEILRLHPGLEHAADGPALLALLVKGAMGVNLPLAARPAPAPTAPLTNGQARSAAGAAPAPLPAFGPLPGASPALPAGATAQPNSSAFFERFRASGDIEDRTAWVKAALTRG